MDTNQIEQVSNFLVDYVKRVRAHRNDVAEAEALSLLTQLVGKVGVEALKEGAKLRVQHSGLSFIHGEYETVRCVPLEVKGKPLSAKADGILRLTL